MPKRLPERPIAELCPCIPDSDRRAIIGALKTYIFDAGKSIEKAKAVARVRGQKLNVRERQHMMAKMFTETKSMAENTLKHLETVLECPPVGKTGAE